MLITSLLRFSMARFFFLTNLKGLQQQYDADLSLLNKKVIN